MSYLFLFIKIIILFGTIVLFLDKKFKNTIIMLIGQVVVVSIGLIYVVIPTFLENITTFDPYFLINLVRIAELIGAATFAVGFVLFASSLKNTITEE